MIEAQAQTEHAWRRMCKTIAPPGLGATASRGEARKNYARQMAAENMEYTKQRGAE